MRVRDGQEVGKEGLGIFVRGIVGHDCDLRVKKSTNQEEVPTFRVFDLFLKRKWSSSMKHNQYPALLRGGRGRIDLWILVAKVFGRRLR